MKAKSMKLTTWAFWIGAVISVLVGVLQAAQLSYNITKWIPVVLVVLGILVGLMNITAREITSFLIAAIALVALGSGGLTTLDSLIPKLGTLLGSSVQAFSFFIGAAAIVVAIKESWMLAANK